MIFAFTFLIQLMSFSSLEQQSNNLELNMVCKKPEAGYTTAEPLVVLYVKNNSKTERRKIINPADGSEWAWREPYIYFTAEMIDSLGKWTELKTKRPGRCGMYNGNWEDDVSVIAPGQKKEIYNKVLNLNYWFEITGKGKIKLCAHYDYGSGKHTKGQTPGSIKKIQGISDFALTSQIVDWEIK